MRNFTAIAKNFLAGGVSSAVRLLTPSSLKIDTRSVSPLLQRIRSISLGRGIVDEGHHSHFVDHDLANRGFLRECLEKEGHQVATLNSGLEVGPFLAKAMTRLCILNIDTPGVREKDLLFQIKKAGPSRILLVVSKRGDSFLKEAIDLGVYGFIYKPFDLEEVCTVVNHLTR